MFEWPRKANRIRERAIGARFPRLVPQRILWGRAAPAALFLFAKKRAGLEARGPKVRLRLRRRAIVRERGLQLRQHDVVGRAFGRRGGGRDLSPEVARGGP